jgi:mycothiol synthase
MKTITLRPAKLDRDFGELAALFSLEQDEPTSEPGLIADFKTHRERIFRLMVAEDEHGQLLGFNWATRSRFDANQAYFFVIVKPEYRGNGVGRQLYEDLERSAKKSHIKQLQVSIRDTCPDCRAFADRRGFSEQSHYIGLALDLDTFDDRHYDEIIETLKDEGLRFTSLEALGNTAEMQRKLYLLNDSTAMETIVSDGHHSWLSFDDFQKKTCQAEWFKPGGQMIAIDTATGTWAAMSAITRFEGYDHAYNLHTGVDKRYHGRNLAQAMLTLALRYARRDLKVSRVQANENAEHLSTIAIYRELGYTQISGTFSMEKNLE